MGSGASTGEKTKSENAMKHHLPTGKLPPELLARLLGKIQRHDKRVMVGGQYGEDAAVIEFGGPDHFRR